MIRRLLPKTMVGQLMALLATVLILAQMINLALLVGSQRLQARTNAFTAAVEQASRLATDVPDTVSGRAPFSINPGRGGAPGSFFLSYENRAIEFETREDLPRYNTLFRETLEENGVVPRATSVTFLAKSPIIGGPEEGPRRRLPPRHEIDSEPSRGGPKLGGDEVGFNPPPPFRDRGLGYGFRGGASLQEIRLSAELGNGLWFNALMPLAATEPLRARILAATILLLSLSLFAVWVFARRISRPISAFANAADELGRGNASELLPETGPQDMRQAAAAFNNMQTRLMRMLETQRNMLRAVGHDLRTPLTSLRLRAENIPDETERNKIISTLNDMTVMTEEILSWAQDASGTEELATVDLGSFLESLEDDYQDRGQDVKLIPFQSKPIKIRRVSVKRALQNLINNALQYGNSAVLRVDQNCNWVTIHIDDKGPGISEAKLEDVLKPFVRLEGSRSKETGGTGLGLSIADTIAQIHGGTLRLSNRQEGGLRASVKLPC